MATTKLDGNTYEYDPHAITSDFDSLCNYRERTLSQIERLESGEEVLDRRRARQLGGIDGIKRRLVIIERNINAHHEREAHLV